MVYPVHFKRALLVMAFILLALSLGYILNKTRRLHRKISKARQKIAVAA